MYVVDLERHNDGEDGLVGPFQNRAMADLFVATIKSDFIRKYATIRPVAAVVAIEGTPE